MKVIQKLEYLPDQNIFILFHLFIFYSYSHLDSRKSKKINNKTCHNATTMKQ